MYVVSQIANPTLVFYLTNEGVGREAVGSGNLIKEITDCFVLTKEDADLVQERLSAPEAISYFGGRIRTEVTEVKNWEHYIKLKGLRGKF